MGNTPEMNFEIVSISYLVNGEIHTMKPIGEQSTQTNVNSLIGGGTMDSEGQCNPGDTRCIDNKLQRCVNIGEGQCIWMESSETC